MSSNKHLTREEWEAIGVWHGPQGHGHWIANDLLDHGLAVDQVAAMTPRQRSAMNAELREQDRAAKEAPQLPYAEAAVTYAVELGFAIFPASPKTKRPLIKTGRDHAEHASKDPALVRSWFNFEFPSAAIACATGAASGIVVIDVDKKHDGELVLKALESRYGAVDRSFVVRTQSGGVHIYLKHPGGRIKSCVGGDSSPWPERGVDVRADGGIVLLPPSLGYKWESFADDDRLPSLPETWTEILLAPARNERESVDVVVEYDAINGELGWAWEILKHHRRRYRFGKRDGDRERGELLDRLISRLSIAELGSRDSAITRLGFIVGLLLPGIGPDVAGSMATMSLLRTPTSNDGEDFRHWLKKFQNSYEKGALARREQDERNRREWAQVAELLGNKVNK